MKYIVILGDGMADYPVDFFDGKTDLPEAIRRIQSNTRRYMRKQETWFKKDKDIVWFSPTDIKEIIKYIDKSVKFVRK